MTDDSRFSITAQRVATATSLPLVVTINSKFTTGNGKLLVTDISNKTYIYVCDMLGHLIVNLETRNNSLEIPLPRTGDYSVYMQVGEKYGFHSIINCLKK